MTFELIEIGVSSAICCICGVECENKWGVPIDAETALICGNDHIGKLGAKPACRECYEKHSNGQFIGHDPEF